MGQWLTYGLVRGLMAGVGLLPFWVLYRMSDGLYWLVYRLLGYRKAVVRDNLRRAFPDRSAAERLAIERRFYRFLMDVLLESLKGFSLSEEQLRARVRYTTPQVPRGLTDGGQSVMTVGGHYGNWEWAALVSAFYSSDPVVLYEPLRNARLDAYVKGLREQQGAVLRSGREALRVFGARAEQVHTFVLIADQSPSNPGRAYWLPFLNRDTAVLRGPAIFAHRYDLPFLYLSIQRVGRGQYEMGVEVLTTSPRDYTPDELIALYWQRLEQQIEAEPAHWLWSHRRWKHQRS